MLQGHAYCDLDCAREHIMHTAITQCAGFNRILFSFHFLFFTIKRPISAHSLFTLHFELRIYILYHQLQCTSTDTYLPVFPELKASRKA